MVKESTRHPARPALEGIRVLDLTRVLAGPYCTVLLADAGAEVTKVESPGGDDSRHLGPFLDGESIYFDIVNRGKRSVCLNLKDPADRAVLDEMVRESDVLVENFRPGVAKRLGIDYETLSLLNPQLIYASISGFGQTGELAGAAAYDLVVQALSGIMSITGHPESSPTRIGESFGDLIAGVFAAWGISTALLERSRSGLGQYLDISMFESLLAVQPTAFSQLQVTGEPPARVGNRHPISTPFDTFEALDGPVVIATANQASFERLAAAIGRIDLIEDPRFTSDELRTANEQELKRVIEEWTGRHSAAEVVEKLRAASLGASRRNGRRRSYWTLRRVRSTARASRMAPTGSRFRGRRRGRPRQTVHTPPAARPPRTRSSLRPVKSRSR